MLCGFGNQRFECVTECGYGVNAGAKWTDILGFLSHMYLNKN